MEQSGRKQWQPVANGLGPKRLKQAWRVAVLATAQSGDSFSRRRRFLGLAVASDLHHETQLVLTE